MYYATLNEAFGVDSFEPPPKKEEKVARVKFSNKILGEDVDIPTDPPATFAPRQKPIDRASVRKYISTTYAVGGVEAVWNLLEPRVQTHIISMCNESANSIHRFFDDILSSPDKMLVLLAVLFMLIMLLDVSQDSSRVRTTPMEYPQFYPIHTSS
jgi:hypothetical protein